MNVFSAARDIADAAYQWARTEGRNYGVAVADLQSERPLVVRSAAPDDAFLEDKIRELGICTVIDLRLGIVPADEQTRVWNAGKRAGHSDIRYEWVPLHDYGPDTYDLATVDRVASLLDSQEKQPVWIFCAGGRHRTGAIIFVYRLRFSGWTWERAWKEIRHYGFYRWKHQGWDAYIQDLKGKH